jgi:hypothetical protein
MTEFSQDELRSAARLARSLALSLTEPAKQNFLNLAVKWDAEALAIEQNTEILPFGSATISFTITG